MSGEALVPVEPSRPSAAADVFAGADHPNGRSAALYFAHYFAPPLSALLTTLMVLTLIVALQSLPIIVLIVAGGLASFAGAGVWTSIRLRTKTVEVQVIGPAVALRTAAEVLENEPVRALVLTDLRVSDGMLSGAVPDFPFQLYRGDWPAFEDLTVRLTEARQAARALGV